MLIKTAHMYSEGPLAALKSDLANNLVLDKKQTITFLVNIRSQ